ncbi:MAG: hypothetical protein M3170_02900 [Candidatus Dormibacteraeota bacterium]|nr:hypothetical protein [Candidatus Dormibacteraeota bacterium]MDQ6920532.1 hypothetical protein [Candidatus Dormibacteraeota bacterium]
MESNRPDGKVLAAPNQVLPDGSAEMKFPWWLGVRGNLAATGRRLDATSPPRRADIPLVRAFAALSPAEQEGLTSRELCCAVRPSFNRTT